MGSSVAVIVLFWCSSIGAMAVLCSLCVIMSYASCRGVGFQFSVVPCDDVMELCAQGCGRFGKGSPMFLVVPCDDVVHELFASGRYEVSRIE